MGIPDASTFADALDSLSAGLFFVEATGRILHANASAHAMLRRRSILRAANDGLVACDPGSAQALRQAVSGVANATAAARAVAVPLRSSDGPHCIAYVLPLALGAHGRSGARHAALLVHRAVLELPSPPEAIAGLYGLTPTELRVLSAIVQVGGVRETAVMLGISKATVKTHLHRLFAKTGATRQADLVRLVAGFANPLVGQFPALGSRAASVAVGRVAAQEHRMSGSLGVTTRSAGCP